MLLTKRSKQYLFVFRVRIDFKCDTSHQKPLSPGGYYYLDNRSEKEVSYNDIVDEAIRIINTELKIELKKYTNFPVKKVQVQAVFEGSIEIIYTVALGFLNLVGGLKDLYDAVHLICEISEKHINKKLSDKFGRHFKVDTYAIVPREDDYWRFEKRHGAEREYSRDVERDAFFYYLLVANIVLLLIVGVLVFGAVQAVYFG